MFLTCKVSFWFAAKQQFYGRKKTAPNAPDEHFRSAAPRRTGGRRKPAWAVNMVVQLFIEGRRSNREVWKEFNRLYAADGMTVCLGTIYAWM